MIDKAKLDEWQRAKVIAISNPNMDREVMVAFQEMFIEAKELRRDNFTLLNVLDVLEKMAEFMRLAKQCTFLDEQMEDLYEEVQDLALEMRIPVDLSED